MTLNLTLQGHSRSIPYIPCDDLEITSQLSWKTTVVRNNTIIIYLYSYARYTGKFLQQYMCMDIMALQINITSL